jgi:hypothetical protein
MAAARHWTRLLPLVYDELRRLAHSYLTRERPGHTLQTTALVHEAYLKLIDQRSVNWQNHGQFLPSPPGDAPHPHRQRAPAHSGKRGSGTQSLARRSCNHFG